MATWSAISGSLARMRRIAPWATTQYWHWLAFARRHHDHLALGLGQIARLVHQRVVIGEERAELVRPMGEHQKHVGDEADFSWTARILVADVVGHVDDFRNRETADRMLFHENPPPEVASISRASGSRSYLPECSQRKAGNPS